MSKKHFLFASLAAMGLIMGACSNEVEAPVAESADTVTFTTRLPGNLQSRYGEGLNANTLRYAVYESGTTNIVFTSETGDGLTTGPTATYHSEDLTFSLTLTLVKGQTYDLVFWAQNDNTTAYDFDPTTQTISVNYDGIEGNDENRDAFFNVEKELLVKGAMQKSIELYRPFAQLNIGTNDVNEAKAAGVTIDQTQVIVKGIYNQLNLFTGAASASDDFSGDVTYTYHPQATGTFPKALEEGEKPYTYLSMNYILTGKVMPDKEIVYQAQKETKNIEIAFKDNNGNGINTFNLSSVPFQRNYRTNIYGSLLTSGVDYTIEIKPDFTKDDYDVEGPVTDAE